MHRPLVVVGLVALVLACGGLPTEARQVPPPVTPPPTATPPAIAAVFADVLEAAPARVAKPAGPVEILALVPTKDACEWRRWTPAGSKVWFTTAKCATAAHFSADGSRVLYESGDEVIEVGTAAGSTPVVYTRPADLPGEIAKAWYGADGVARLAVMAKLDQEPGGTAVAGPYSAAYTMSEGLSRYGVKGVEVVAPGQGDRDVEFDATPSHLAVFLEKRDADWVVVTALPTFEYWMDGMTFGPGISVGGPLTDAAKGFSFEDGEDTDAGDSAAPESWNTNLALGGDLKANDDSHVGFYAVGNGGLVYRIEVGDTPHAMAPLFWCTDRTCGKRTAFEGVKAEQLGIFDRGDYLLVGKEYQLDEAVVFKVGETKPLVAFEGATRVMWVNGLSGA